MKKPLFRKQRFGAPQIAVNQEAENRKVMMQLKQFESVTNYCEQVKCRHQTIAKHFGDQTAICKDRCDACTIGKQVSRNCLKLLIRLQLSGIKF